VFIELADHLRCVRPLDDTWLVASAERMDGRDIVEGLLGCPVCAAEYRIENGAALFAPRPGRPDATGSARVDDPPGDAALRVAALLGLADPAGFALLAGEWAAYAPALHSLTGVNTVALNPARGAHGGAAGVSVVYAPPGLVPLAAGSMRAAAVDASTVAAGGFPSAVRSLRARGRLVAPAGATLPADVVELARDADEWVAERTGVTSAPVRLGLARRR
jgi:hypothetical protein